MSQGITAEYVKLAANVENLQKHKKCWIFQQTFWKPVRTPRLSRTILMPHARTSTCFRRHWQFQSLKPRQEQKYTTSRCGASALNLVFFGFNAFYFELVRWLCFVNTILSSYSAIMRRRLSHQAIIVVFNTTLLFSVRSLISLLLISGLIDWCDYERSRQP